MTGASSSVGLSTQIGNVGGTSSTGVEYVEMSATGSSSAKFQNLDTLKTLDATQLPKGKYGQYGD